MDISTTSDIRRGGTDDDIYNLQASIECLKEIDVPVFIFLSYEDYRFRKFGPLPESDQENQYFSENNPKEIHSSVVVELHHWMHMMSLSADQVFVIYENDIQSEVGSLVRGLIKSSEVSISEIETASRGGAIEKLKLAVSGQARIWETIFADVLRERKRRTL